MKSDEFARYMTQDDSEVDDEHLNVLTHASSSATISANAHEQSVPPQTDTTAGLAVLLNSNGEGQKSHKAFRPISGPQQTFPEGTKS
jgi:hypothetical protein